MLVIPATDVRFAALLQVTAVLVSTASQGAFLATFYHDIGAADHA